MSATVTSPGPPLTSNEAAESKYMPGGFDSNRSIETAKLLGADAVELQTARYAEARTPAERHKQLDVLREAAAFAVQQALHLHMGHGLTYTNVRDVARIPGLEELNIGHSIVSRAVLVGMERAVRDMKEALARAEEAG